MLVVVQIPFADLRPLLAVPTYRLDRPHWASPLDLIGDVGKSFVRGMGSLRTRRGHGDPSWENEGIFCSAKNAIRFPDHFEAHQFSISPNKAPISGFNGSSASGSRRFYAYGPIARFEIGMSRRWAPYRLLGNRLDEFLRSVLAVPLRIGEDEECTPLYAAQAKLGELVLRSTTSTMKTPDPALCKLLPGRPAIIVEYREQEIDPRLPNHPLLPDEYNIDLSYRDVRLGNTEAQAWLLGINKSSDRDALRRVRIHLARLHAELECARLALSALPSLKIKQVDIGEVNSYLLRFTNLLNKQTAYGHPQDSILKQALAAHQTQDPDNWPAVQQAAARNLAWIKERIQYFPTPGVP